MLTNLDLSQIQLSTLVAFLKIAKKKSFSAAALELRVSPPALSQSIKQLESRLGVALFARTTRSVRLTQAGELFADRCSSALEQLQESIGLVKDYAQTPSGLLRLTLPRGTYFDLIEPLLPAFHAAFPQIEVEFFLADEFIDIIEMGFDGGIRSSELVSKEMTSVRLSKPFKFLVTGSREYFKKHGRPKKPEDLLQHDCLRYRFSDGDMYDEWEFERGGKEFTIKLGGKWIANDAFVARSLAASGLTLIYMTEQSVARLADTLNLETVLEEYGSRTEGYFLYFPNRAQVQPKMRAFIDFTREWFKAKK